MDTSSHPNLCEIHIEFLHFIFISTEKKNKRIKKVHFPMVGCTMKKHINKEKLT